MSGTYWTAKIGRNLHEILEVVRGPFETYREAYLMLGEREVIIRRMRSETRQEINDELREDYILANAF